MHPIGTKELETERLQLRRFKRSDAEAMFKIWANDPVVTEYLMFPIRISKKQSSFK